MEYIIKVLSICLLILVGTITISYFAMQADIDYIESETKEARDFPQTFIVKPVDINGEYNISCKDELYNRVYRYIGNE